MRTLFTKVGMLLSNDEAMEMGDSQLLRHYSESYRVCGLEMQWSTFGLEMRWWRTFGCTRAKNENGRDHGGLRDVLFKEILFRGKSKHLN